MFLITTIFILVIAIFISLIRLIIGPTVWERLLALNLISAKTILILSIYGVYKENVMLLDVAFSYGIIGFLSIILLSRLILMGGRQK